MKIIHIIPNLKRGGAERICIDICNELQNQGHDVLLILFYNKNEYRELTSQLNIRVIPSSFTPSILKSNNVKIEKLEKAVAYFKPDIIHSHLYEADLVAFQLKVKNVKFFSHIHSNRKELQANYKTENLKQKLIFSFEKRLYKNLLKQKSVYQIAISQDCFNFVTLDLKSPLNKVSLLPNCIDYELFKGLQKSITNLTEIKLIAVGRFDENKDQLFLIDVLRKLTPNFKLIFLGQGVLLKKVQNYVVENNLQKQVIFKGIVTNPQDDLKLADIFVHAAKKEAFGLVLIEAMASGLPIVTTDGGGNKDIVINNENGFMLEYRHPELFANKVIQLINSPKDYERISKNCINFASKYDVKKYAKTLLSLYNYSLI
jgi:glycosyltransferase involved in cell wall biosynthesis